MLICSERTRLRLDTEPRDESRTEKNYKTSARGRLHDSLASDQGGSKGETRMNVSIWRRKVPEKSRTEATIYIEIPTSHSYVLNGFPLPSAETSTFNKSRRPSPSSKFEPFSSLQCRRSQSSGKQRGKHGLMGGIVLSFGTHAGCTNPIKK